MVRSLAIGVWLAASLTVFAQPPTAATVPPPAPPPPPPSDGGLTVRDSSVGYIDSAAIADQARLRGDFGFDFRNPNRAEFFYPRGKPGGPGLPFGERSVDFQDHSLYLEKTLGPAWSIFAEGGLRFLNPDFNANAYGLADANVGLKYALTSDENSAWTFQLRTYLPTGAAGRGLGTRHVSIEPAVLGFVSLTSDLGLAAEARYWQPVGGTDFAGPVVRYGLGARYNLWESSGCRLSPTLEVIGWTVLSGQESRLLPDGALVTSGSGGATVVNVKAGARLDVGDRAGFYAGYGRAVTGDRWYRDVLRVEFRWLF